MLTIPLVLQLAQFFIIEGRNVSGLFLLFADA
jgi:hypothetical protein